LGGAPPAANEKSRSRGLRWVRHSERPSSLNQIDDQHNDCDYEQQMDQSAANVAEKTKKPENDENHKYRPQHNFIPVKFV